MPLPCDGDAGGMEIAGGREGTISLEKTDFYRLFNESDKPLVLPLSISLPVDGISPVDLYHELTSPAAGTIQSGSMSGRGFLLESLDRDTRADSYSFLGINPVLRISIGGSVDSTGDPRLVSLVKMVKGDDAIEVMRKISGIFTTLPSNLPRFSGGFAGYFSYDLVYSLIPATGKSRHQQNSGPQVAEFMLCTECVVFDHARDTLTIIVNAVLTDDQEPGEEYDRKCSALKSLVRVVQQFQKTRSTAIPAALQDSTAVRQGHQGQGTVTAQEVGNDERVPVNLASAPEKSPGLPEAATLIPGQGKDDFIRSVKKVKNYIRRGEIVQAVISRREQYPFSGEPSALYRSLREVNPSPYMYFLDFPGHAVVGASPEMLVRVEGKGLTTVPIAGTRRRGRTPVEDQKLAEDLLNDGKERAEHVMLVDLARNDVGSICRYGSVRVPRFMEIGRYSHVQHIVSTVTGEIRDGSDRFDGLKACFPAGTVTGAPKIRAMQIIDELEPGPRGLYAGAVGYIGFDNQLEFAITIRTADIRDGIASVQAGAGIVADSCPLKEWTETNDKAEAMRSAIRSAGGLA